MSRTRGEGAIRGRMGRRSSRKLRAKQYPGAQRYVGADVLPSPAWVSTSAAVRLTPECHIADELGKLDKNLAGAQVCRFLLIGSTTLTFPVLT